MSEEVCLVQQTNLPCREILLNIENKPTLAGTLEQSSTLTCSAGIRICSECGKDETINKFKKKGKKCIKCYSKKNNQKLGPEYFKKYYLDNKKAIPENVEAL